MNDGILARSAFRWKVPFTIAAIALITSLLLTLWDSDLGELITLFLIAPLVAVTLLCFASGGFWHTKLIRASIFILYGLLSWLVVTHSADIREQARWLAESRSWKQKVLEQSAASASGMKYAVWDGWGWFGQDTDVYLVFSPNDRLRDYSAAHLAGLPCPVWKVRRLQKQWYSVTFYTNEGWEWCEASAK